jgi:hypothetical protein
MADVVWADAFTGSQNITAKKRNIPRRLKWDFINLRLGTPFYILEEQPIVTRFHLVCADAKG